MLTERREPRNTNHADSVSGTVAPANKGADAVMKTNAEVARALRVLREAARPRLSQAAVGTRIKIEEKIGVAQTTVSQWESGANRLGVEEMVAYADVLGWDLVVELRPRTSGPPSLPPPAVRFLETVEGLSDSDVDEILQAVALIRAAPPDALHYAIGVLRSAASRRG